MITHERIFALACKPTPHQKMNKFLCPVASICAYFLLCLPLSTLAQVPYFNFSQSLYNADVTISADPTSNGSFLTPGIFTPNASANAANVNITDVIGLLNTGTPVSINTANSSGTGAGNITLGSAITWEGTSPSVGLNLNASNDVFINGVGTATTGSFNFNAYDNINVNNAMTVTTGNLTYNAGNNITMGGGAMTTTTGNMTFLASNDINLNFAATITPGIFTAVAGGFADMNEPITVTNGSTTVTSGGAPEIDGALAPQVGLLIGALLLLFLREKQMSAFALCPKPQIPLAP
jgi:hypothetical protein